MRNLEQELQHIIEFAKRDDNIRALVLQGSFVNPNIKTDEFSDLDPLFFVKNLKPYISKDEWKKEFGNPISGFSDEGNYHDGEKWYTRLTIYDDGFKIDFGFQSIEMAKYANEMPLYKIYLDKDGILPTPEVTDERKFYVKQPTEVEFLDRVNAFFYDSSYVAKALARNEMFFVKYMESVLQEKIKKLMDWYIGIQHDFKVNVGLMGRYYRRYLTDDVWNMLLATYSNGNRSASANGLIHMFELVEFLGRYISKELGFKYPEKHNQDMLAYCKNILNKYI